MFVKLALYTYSMQEESQDKVRKVNKTFSCHFGFFKAEISTYVTDKTKKPILTKTRVFIFQLKQDSASKTTDRFSHITTNIQVCWIVDTTLRTMDLDYCIDCRCFIHNVKQTLLLLPSVFKLFHVSQASYFPGYADEVSWWIAAPHHR